jgi:hypothetical protein
MQLLGDSSEDEMIAAFLHAELSSERFGPQLHTLLRQDRVDQHVISTPDLTSATENAYRRVLLGRFRGYGHNRDLFDGFPSVLTWQRVALAPAEVLTIRYINYEYWVALSGGTRLPSDAAQAIQEGRCVFDVGLDGFLRTVQALRQGAQFPELICVRRDISAPLVVLEGHLRLTAYALAPEMIPSPTTSILGTAAEIVRWGCY